jgi:hypothetical protein
MDRDWLDLNRWKFITIPYAACCKGVVEPKEGDIGFEREKVEMPKPRRFCDYSRDDYESVGDMMKVRRFDPVPETALIPDQYPSRPAPKDGYESRPR